MSRLDFWWGSVRNLIWLFVFFSTYNVENKTRHYVNININVFNV